MKKKPNVTICGCGSAGVAIAADVALMGCTVSLFEHPNYAANLEPIREHGGITLSGNTCSGKTGKATFKNITSNPGEALEGSDLVMITVPAQAHETFFETLTPHMREGQVVLVNTGYWASLRSIKILEKHGKLGKVIVAEEHIMPYLSRKIGPAQAHIYNFKRDLRFSAFPAKENGRIEELLKAVYPQFLPSKDVLENNFFPGNASVHAQITIPKAAFFFEHAKEFRFYGEVSQSASKLADAFDKERINVAKAFGCNVPHVFEWTPRTYGYQGKDIYEMYGNVTCEHAKRWGNQEGNKRVLEEDICYFFLPMEELAGIVGVDVPVTRAMTDIMTVFVEYDYRSKGVTLKDLGMGGMTKNEISEFLRKGQI